jgi:bifunctional DNase/RNase
MGAAICLLACSGKAATKAGDAPPVPFDATPAGAARAPPAGYVEMHAIGVIPTEQGNAALLTTVDEQVYLPIFIGETEAASIQHRLDHRPPARPLTHDLLDTLLTELDAQLVEVHVRDLQAGIFLGNVLVRHAGRIIEVDARPSDAIALAIGNRVPIYVNQRVLDAAGLQREDLEKGTRDAGAGPI